jgi:hypothetical protein
MAFSAILPPTVILLSGAGQLAIVPTDGTQAARLALARVCLPGVVEARPIEPLAKAEGMTMVSPTTVGAGPTDKAWRADPAAPAYAVAWADGSCTATLLKGDKDAARTMAEKEILSRPERFKHGATMLADHGRVEQSVYCAQVRNVWAVVTIAVPGPKGDARTRAFSSTTYLRPTRSPLCG